MDWKFIKSCILEKYSIFQVRQDEYHNQLTPQKFNAIVLQAQDSVNIIAVTPYKEIVMVNQFRYGIKDFSLEIPGGMIDEGEDPMDSAKRELKEETGYTSQEWFLLGSIYSNPVFMDNQCHHYLALNAVKTTEFSPDPEEQINIELIHVNDIRKQGLREINHPHTLSALCRYLDFDKHKL